ncbi:hypothetical protein EI555_016236, partial [Monodon monoceros]
VEGGRLFKVRQKEASAWEPGGLDPGREWNGVGAAASAVPPAPARPPGLSAPSPRAPSSLAPAAPAAASSLSPPPLPLASPPPLPPSPPPLLPPPLSPPPPPQPPPTSPPPPFPPGHPGPCRVPERRRLRCGPLDPEPAEPELGGQTDTLMHIFLAPSAMPLLPPAGAGQGSRNRPGSTRGPKDTGCSIQPLGVAAVRTLPVSRYREAALCASQATREARTSVEGRSLGRRGDPGRVSACAQRRLVGPKVRPRFRQDPAKPLAAGGASTAPASAPDAGAHSAPAHAGPGSSLRPPSNPASGKAVLGSDRLHIRINLESKWGATIMLSLPLSRLQPMTHLGWKVGNDGVSGWEKLLVEGGTQSRYHEDQERYCDKSEVTQKDRGELDPAVWRKEFVPTGHLGVTEVPGMWSRPRVFAGVSVQKVELSQDGVGIGKVLTLMPRAGLADNLTDLLLGSSFAAPSVEVTFLLGIVTSLVSFSFRILSTAPHVATAKRAELAGTSPFTYQHPYHSQLPGEGERRPGKGNEQEIHPRPAQPSRWQTAVWRLAMVHQPQTPKEKER